MSRSSSVKADESRGDSVVHAVVVLPAPVMQAAPHDGPQACHCREVKEEHCVGFLQPDGHRAGVIPIKNPLRLGREDTLPVGEVLLAERPPVLVVIHGIQVCDRKPQPPAQLACQCRLAGATAANHDDLLHGCRTVEDARVWWLAQRRIRLSAHAILSVGPESRAAGALYGVEREGCAVVDAVDEALLRMSRCSAYRVVSSLGLRAGRGGHSMQRRMVSWSRSSCAARCARQSLLGLLGLRILEASGTNIVDVGEEHSHRVLQVFEKAQRRYWCLRHLTHAERPVPPMNGGSWLSS